MRIRTIKPEFWHSESFIGISHTARLLAVGLLNHSDDEGYFKALPSLIRSQLFPYEEIEVEYFLRELTDCNYIRVRMEVERLKNGFIKETRTGRVLNFQTHQVVNHPRASILKQSFKEMSIELYLEDIAITLFSNIDAPKELPLPSCSGNNTVALLPGMEWKGMEGKGMECGSDTSNPDIIISSKKNRTGKVKKQKESSPDYLVLPYHSAEFKSALKDMISGRKKLKTPDTIRSRNLLYGNIIKYSNNSESYAIKMLDIASSSGWKSVFPLKGDDLKDVQKKDLSVLTHIVKDDGSVSAASFNSYDEMIAAGKEKGYVYSKEKNQWTKPTRSNNQTIKESNSIISDCAKKLKI